MREFAHPGSTEQAPADLNHAIETTITVACNEYKSRAYLEARLGQLPPVMCNVGELNGYGDSTRVPGGLHHVNYSKRAMARDQIEVMAKFGHDRFAVIGHDRGGRVAHRIRLGMALILTLLVLAFVAAAYFAHPALGGSRLCGLRCCGSYIGHDSGGNLT